VDEKEDLFDGLKKLGRKIKIEDASIAGVKVIVFFRDGKVFEYNTKMDEKFKEEGRRY